MGSVGNTISIYSNKYSIKNDSDFSIMESLNPDNYTGYARFLASSLQMGTKYELYEFSEGEGRAFVQLNDTIKNYTVIEDLGSTGNRTGTEVLLRVMTQTMEQGKNLMWKADNENSISYYNHLGLDKYSSNVTDIIPEMGKRYIIPNDKLRKEILRLRRKY